MARIVKEPEVRREELLSAAMELFMVDGYDGTSVERITAHVGVAKGTFYHYFTSKQDLLGQLAESFTNRLFEAVEMRLEGETADALTRLRIFIEESSEMKMGMLDESIAVSRSMYTSANLELRHRLVEGWVDRTRPIILPILVQGSADGTFDIADPVATTEVWLSLWYDYGWRLAAFAFDVAENPEHAGLLVAGMSALETAQERLLGLPAHSLPLPGRENLLELLA